MTTVNKPTKPKKKIYLPAGTTFYFDHTSKKVSLSYFLDWIKETLPKGATDVTISMDEDCSEYDGSIISCYLQVEWKVKRDNPRYEKEFKKYKKQLAEWKEQCRK
jgi:hypothetical protein